ncbi:DUF305 domain-containing protein [Microbispora sp. RL4-1S]|uniref:DUF305 domain-containing protein n=1 Tax=Microbispora oryzae TaxID=2806554 RepID=A0A940WEA8_9ACTN|nr:DUF305 domain-containing protein [Microbispora oryzae]MBP2702572.1 DUF305 domain-containing protein [Microbispora oryzae]
MSIDSADPPGPAPRPRHVLPVLGVIALLVAGALLVFSTRSDTPGDTSPEAGFARDMAIHHAQAVDMSIIVRDQTKDGPLRTLSYDIITTQGAQLGIFMGWLQAWGLKQASAQPPMAWMSGHAHGGAPPTAPTAPAAVASGGSYMPGMATEEEMNRLKAATGKQAEILFLQLMIRHHEGGLEMAEGLLKLSDRPEVRDLAQHIVTGQTAEIRMMKEMLTERGAQPLPSILPASAA